MTEVSIARAEPTTRDRLALERRVGARIREFDLGALLRTLAHLGYRGSSVLLESNAEEASPESLVESIRFEHTPRRLAIVTVNMGLLGTQGLLPSYFLRAIEPGDARERFFDFIRFFDDRLINDRVRALYPERDRVILPNFDATRRHYLGILGFGSTLSMHRILRDVFPELAVRVRRARVRTSVATSAVRTGTSYLDGSAVLGGSYDVEPAGLSVDLVCDDGVMETGERWPAVILERLRSHIFPLIAPHRVALTVRLTTLAHGNWVRVEPVELGATSELGFDRVKSGEEARHSVLLYAGIP